MPTPTNRTRAVFWTFLSVGVLWIALGDRVLTHFAYAVERGRIQASAEELARLHAELPEVNAVSRAFRLVANVANPGVVHIRVAGGPTEREIRERLRERMEDMVPEDQLEFWLRRMPPHELGAGSGIILDSDGHILTNNHVVSNHDQITVTLHDDREFSAELVGTDPMSDLAVIRIEAADLHPLTFGDSSAVEVGDWVVAVGSPFGLTRTVTHGIVSAVGRTNVGVQDVIYQDFIQTDAAINPGNSGGPLLNLRGEVIGVNTAIATRGESNAGVAFCIPANMALKVAGQLKSRGEVQRGWLGISMDELTPEDADIFGLPGTRGVMVNQVFADSPAAEAGIEVEDVIIAVEGVAVDNLDRLRALVADLTPGDVARFRVVRDGRERDLRVRMGLRPTSNRPENMDSSHTIQVNRLGFNVRTFRPGSVLEHRMPFDNDARGAVILGFQENATTQGQVSLHEMIIECNGQRIRTARELRDAVERLPTGRTVELKILEPSGDVRIVPLRPEQQQ